VPRRWDRRELLPRKGTAAESARLARYAARLLAATATAAAVSTLVAHGTEIALLEPARAGQGADAAAAPAEGSGDDRASFGEPDPGDPDGPGPGLLDPTGSPDRAEGTSPTDRPRSSVPGDEPESSGTGQDLTSPPAPTQPAPDQPTPGQPAPGTEFVTLVDDDRGLPLFSDGPLAPGDRTVRCITVTYDGSSDTAPVRMAVEATGPLAGWLDVSVTAGTPTTRDCAGFVEQRPVAGGTLGDLTARSSLTAFDVVRASAGVPFGVRITTELRAGLPTWVSGSSASGRFVWSTS
jgi:hypothetical protein